MHNYLLNILKRLLLIGVMLASSLIGWTQEYTNGVRKGMIKVKFSPTTSNSINEVQVNARRDKLVTGIKAVDDAGATVSARGMRRLFPYDPKHEAKLRKHGLHLWYVVEIGEGVDPRTAVSRFKHLREVTVAEVEHEKRLAPYTVTKHTDNTASFAALPFNDPMLKDQWHYENSGQTGFKDADINLFEAWAQTAGASNIVVSVHDQGVDVNHPDLKANIWTNESELNGVPNVDDDGNGYVDDIHGYNFQNNKGAVDPQFHGTHVAGTIAAVNNNGIGVSGVAGGTGNGDGVKIMSLQILGGAPIEESYIYAANNGAVISQNSWGYTDPGYVDESVLDAIDYFVEEAGNYPGSPMKGGIVIFAAGNSNVDGKFYPAYHEKVMAVAALGPEWKKAGYSNFGSWIELSAPGGDMQYGPKNGVLSTIPDNQYAYIHGTSMACPHVSGIAALALANRTKQLTNDELWNKLMTGVVDVDGHNPTLTGMLGVGAIDAALAIRNDQGQAPLAINDLSVTGIAQEFATLKWTVPGDPDDSSPASFTLLYHTQPITPANLSSATKQSIRNTLVAGEEFSYEVTGLLGLTTYYFAVTSTDRWGNVSALSNPISETTNEGPSIVVDENSTMIDLTIDASQSTSATHDITISNQAGGILRWNHFMRHISNYSTFNISGLAYPDLKSKTSSGKSIVGMGAAHNAPIRLKNNDPAPLYFNAIYKRLSEVPTNIIGEVDTTLTNSAAGRFYVTEPEGFNLTNVQMYLKHDPAKGPVIVEVYKGNSPTKNNLIFAQEYSAWSDEEHEAYIQLNEQLYFEAGSTFFIVFHVPSGNIYPLGIGIENEASASADCFMSFDLGGSWDALETLLDSKDFAWNMVAASFNPTLGTYITLDPGSGDIEGNGQAVTKLTANAANLVNGSYSSNLVLSSNDGDVKELRIPVNVTVTGHEANIKHVAIADFGSVFQGTSKVVEIVLDNKGYGNLSGLSFNVSDPQFSIVDGGPWQISALEQQIIKVIFSPTTVGSVNASLTFTDGVKSYEIALFGVGTETSKMTITPVSQSISNVVLGDDVQAEITVENTGAYPLKYFIPGHDAKGISSSWPSKFHSYGYQVRTNNASEANPLTYQFQDISTTGTKITDHFKQNWYFEVDMGFEFPYYTEKMKKVYVAKRGFTTFDNTVNPLNVPILNNIYSPRGYISPIGTMIDYAAQGDIFYRTEADRVIIQYSNIWDGRSVGETITAQMVLYYNGDIRFFYKTMGFSEFNQLYLNILIEDFNRKDGILVHDYDHPIPLRNNFAIGFDYPGPNIISSAENGSGVLMPGNSAVVKLNLTTASLAEGTVKRYVNFICNDPANGQSMALVELDIASGGVAKPIVSTDTIDFGDVFQGAVRSSSFTVKNEGTANTEIRTIAGGGTQFTVTGPRPAIIAPGLYRKYGVRITTTTLGPLKRTLTIRYADGTTDLIVVTGNVIEAPGIEIDLTPLQETLAFGDTSVHDLKIKNTGKADLEVVAVGKQWLTYETPGSASPSQAPDNTYSYEKHNVGGIYQWIDIRKSGTQLPFAKDLDDKKQYWRDLDLPFAFEFYGRSYTHIKIGENGIISFDEDPGNMFFEDYLPTATEGVFLMPYWTFAGFNTTFYEKSDVGLFYQFYDDKIIISWNYLINHFGGMGDPVSAQVVLYRNSTIKFQYRIEENGSDQTSVFTSIGAQQDPSNAVVISNHSNLDHGNGLAYILVPAKKHVISPGNVLDGQIKVDARNIYGGQYNESLKIQTNVPGSENLVKPVQLTVTGEGVLSVNDTIDFGENMILFDHGMPVANLKDIEIKNTGSAALNITWADMVDGNQNMSMVIWALAEGWGGREEWRWADISEMYNEWVTEPKTFSLLPGDRLDAKAIFYPSSGGVYRDELVLTTDVGEKKVVFDGSALEPPVIKVTTASVNVVMNKTDETVEKRIKFHNIKGKSDLNYEVSIDYGRPAAVATEAISDHTMANTALVSADIKASAGTPVAMTAYNRTISHTDKEVAEGSVGIGGGTPFTVGTKYIAGPDGFNISHIETWFISGELAEGTIRAEVRAGGTNIANAVKVASGTLDFTGSGSDTKGGWRQITLDQPAAIYPNETFYVVVTYPMGILRPQGTLKNEPTTPGRYFYFDGDFWQDMQEVESAGFNTLAYLMYAAEQTPTNSSWLSIVSPIEGTVAMGDTSSVSIKFLGPIAARGDQVAKVVITSNDPLTPTVRIPVSLHLNEAPAFSNVPVDIQIGEKETLTLKIGVKDAEGHSVTIKASETYSGVTHTFQNGILTITVVKDYGQAGLYNYSFTATDQYDAANELNLTVNVIRTNRPPVFVGEKTLTYYSTGHLEEYSIEEFFNDPDGDAFTFTVGSSDLELVDVFSSKGQFLVKPLSAGEAKLAFTVTDTFGAAAKDTITVIVNNVLGIEETNGGLKVYPNPVQRVAQVILGHEWKGNVSLAVTDAAGRIHVTHNADASSARDIRLDVSALTKGFYILKVWSADRQQSVKLIKE